ncbi:uncharacterized protein LOC133885136 isoform X2 [Phragmites australis]|uniref:uncharacterized protein LOC133885136 isoform X2 n=1 Tax=Phragmites australis TaxID=29695 RepID=UPI002D76EC0C|nr:uncharacterized protein LOC133885136 isoform X2 [Phragmites australis]
MQLLLSLRPPPAAAAAHPRAAASSRTPQLPPRRSAFPPQASASASADFPGSVPDGAQMPPRRRRRRSVAGIDQDELLDPDALADPDSSFYEINGVRVHHKVCSHEDEDSDSPFDQSLDATAADDGRKQIGLPIVLLHGFGASVFSWSRVMRPLARIAGSKVLAFDRPAFGLTSRASWSRDDSKPLNPYSMSFSVMATLAFIDYLGTAKAVLVGHSAGCLVAVDAYFEVPERVAALVLVAPAIFAPRKGLKESSLGEQKEQKQNVPSDENSPPNPFARIWGRFLELCKNIAGIVLKMITAIRDVVRSLYVKALVAVLRSSLGVMLVRWAMDKFGILGVRNAWYDPSKVTDHVVQGYTKGLGDGSLGAHRIHDHRFFKSTSLKEAFRDLMPSARGDW